MIQTVVIAIPGFAALIYCIGRGPERAFLDVYLPVLLLLPLYSWPISGQLTFADTAILPIGLSLLFRSKWRWNSIDFLVIAYVAITVVAEGMNKGYKLGSQNLAVQELCSVLLPYIAAKHVFQSGELAIEAAKRVAMSLTIVAIISVWEFRMGADLFAHLFPGVFPPSVKSSLIRAGFMRSQGPYGHAIALGLMMAIGFRIARWLDWTGAWNDRIPLLPISKIRFCKFWIIAGSIMSISVGPWLGAACGSAVVSVCRARNRTRAMLVFIIVVTVVGGPVHSAFKSFVAAYPEKVNGSVDQLQQDSAYRNQLIPFYTPIVEERPTWGWGRNGFPVLNGMGSIDNGYLLTALTFGLYALILQAVLLVWPPVRLAVFSFPLRHSDPMALAAFGLIGIYLLVAVTIGTVWLGGTESRFLFLMHGWSAALLIAPKYQTAELGTIELFHPTTPASRRVMV